MDAYPVSVAGCWPAVALRFPPLYREFLLETDGGEGPVGEDGWVVFDSIDRVVETNQDAHAEGMFDLFEGIVVFGGDGAGEAYCFDASDQVWRVNWISSREDNMLLGSFMDFLRAEAAGVWDPKAKEAEQP